MKREPPPRTVALLVETSLAPGRDILRGIHRYLQQHGLRWIVYSEPHDLRQPPPRWFRRWKGDGVIARIQNAAILRSVSDKHVPVVDVLGVRAAGRFPLVHVDDAAIARMAARHLLERGFTHFAFFGLGNEAWARQRCDSFSALVRGRGFSCDALTFSRQQWDATPWAELVRRTSRWIARLPLPVGVLLSSDVQGLLFSEACRLAQRHIGQTVGLVSVGNDTTLCETVHPSLSSIDAGHEAVGFQAAALLAALMDGQAAPRRPTLLPPLRVQVRESSDFLAVQDPRVVAAIAYIRRHLGRPIGVADVAEHVGMSVSALHRRFRATLGISVHDQLRTDRIARAVHLLRETGMTVDAVARATGFGYPQNMSRCFRAHLGTPPGAHRRNSNVT